MYRILRIALTVALLVGAAASFGLCAAKKPAKAVPAKRPAAPKLLTVAAGQPFETPSSGAAKVSLTMCADETEPATFTARCGKSLAGVSAACGDLAGPGKIGRQNVTVRLVQGAELLACDNMTLDSSPKQFWVDVTVPKNSKPGVYKGSIAFSAKGKQIDTVPIEVTIRSLRLIGSSKQYALYTSLGLSGQGACRLAGDAYSRFLGAVGKLGFRAVSVSEDPARIGDAFSACAAAGLVGSIPVLTFALGSGAPTIEDARAVESARKTAGLASVYCFCADNPATDQEVQAACERASVLRRAGMQVAATVSDDAAAQKLLPVLDGINYRIDMPYVQALVNGGTSRTNKWEWYWWDARQSAEQNRVNTGVGLWRSGLYGCMPMWMPKDGSDRADNLDSLLAEALREGVNDTRYITTYMKALRELKDKKREKDKDYIAATESYLSSFLSKPLGKLTPGDLRAFRAKMAEFSVKLISML